MMDWKDRMWIAMQDMKEACGENHDLNFCALCPFKKYCEVLSENPKTANDTAVGLNW